jgi:hypothetical protein
MTAIAVVLALSVSPDGLGWTSQAPVSQTGKPPVNRDAKALADFSERVKKYVDLHGKLEDTLPRLPEQTDPTRITEHQTALAKLIAAARPGAKPGDIFTEPVRHIFRRVIRTLLRGEAGKDMRAEILDEDMRPVTLRVNEPYPSDVPLASVPPRMLQALPRLPEHVEYRFVGRQLILFDNHAQIIVDYMTNAIP